MKTEFYETAVRLGYYGIERSGLNGKKDNVRKYWEDISIKLTLRPFIEVIKNKKTKLRVLDLGSGSGEGYELLTHIPIRDHVNSVENDFILTHDNFKEYIGLDISNSMIDQGRANYSGNAAVSFEQCDLTQGLPKTMQEPFDIYFSSYASLSHLTYDELAELTDEIMAHCDGNGIIIYDLLGKYSPEWPVYWKMPEKYQLPYNMAYLYKEEDINKHKFEQFKCSYWSMDELSNMFASTAIKNHKTMTMLIKDRSLFVGRHMDTGLFNNNKRHYRYQVNRLFDRDFRGILNDLIIDLDFIQTQACHLPGGALDKLNHYKKQWNCIISFVMALVDSNLVIMNNILQVIEDSLKEELDMLAWLYRNASRFPVTDFWASIMGPQIACVLRNCEMNYLNAFGCGHGLFTIVEVKNK